MVPKDPGSKPCRGKRFIWDGRASYSSTSTSTPTYLPGQSISMKRWDGWLVGWVETHICILVMTLSV